MLLNTWSIALLICSAGVLFLVAMASITAVKVLLFWDQASDSEQQIELEGRTWLAAVLIENALAVQILSLFLLVLAAGEFSGMIAGAMCATGSFLANEFGTRALYIKITGIFLYGIWIVLHRLDLRSEHLPLVKVKFSYLIFLVPVIFSDVYYLFLYLYNLKPDIITSCCGVIFADGAVKQNFLLFSLPGETFVFMFYLTAFILMMYSVAALISFSRKFSFAAGFHIGAAFLWFFYFLLALVTLTIFFSSYIYAMPYHNCPFDILHKEYRYIGVPIYFALFGGAFFGISSGAATLFRIFPGLSAPVSAYQCFSVKASSLLLLLFVILVTYPAVSYIYAGGEM